MLCATFFNVWSDPDRVRPGAWAHPSAAPPEVIFVGLAVSVLSLALLAQSLWALHLMLYAWQHPERLRASAGPRSFVQPRLFWYRSRLHLYAEAGMIPLGGSTVFIRRALLERVGRWDEGCLTEDADIGVRLSALGERIRVVYDQRYVTREETPHSVRSLVRQRTRWHQGFLQVLRKGDWTRLERRSQRRLALYTLSQPLLDVAVGLTIPLAVAELVLLRLPPVLSILTILPLYALGLQLLTNIVAVFLFTAAFQLRMPWSLPLRIAVTFVPFLCLLSVSAVRAVYREARGINNWEKTAHAGAHRRGGAAAGALLQLAARDMTIPESLERRP